MVPVHAVAAEIAKIHSISVDKIISKLTEVNNVTHTHTHTIGFIINAILILRNGYCQLILLVQT